MSELLIPKLDPICWLKQMCKWWQRDTVCPGTPCEGVTSDQLGEDVRVPGDVAVPIMIRPGILTIRTRLHHHRRRLSGLMTWSGHASGGGCQCRCLSQSARMLSWGYQEADERMKGKLLLVIKTCCEQNIKAGKTNIEHCLWSSCLLRGNVMSSDSTKQKGI